MFKGKQLKMSECNSFANSGASSCNANDSLAVNVNSTGSTSDKAPPPTAPAAAAVHGAPAEVNNADLSADIRKMYELLKDTASKQEIQMNNIQRATTAIEGKLVDITSRISNAESRLDFLEDASKAAEADPPATRSEVAELREMIDSLENRCRRNNLRFVGFPEGCCEEEETLAFIQDTIPRLLNLQFPGGLELDRCHRINTRRNPNDNRPPRPRVIIARFLRFQDREKIATAARKAGKLEWRGNHIMVFPDYSKAVMERRAKFKECKKILHDRQVQFSLIFPATLVIRAPGGRREFTDPKTAMGFINSLAAAAASSPPGASHRK